MNPFTAPLTFSLPPSFLLFGFERNGTVLAVPPSCGSYYCKALCLCLSVILVHILIHTGARAVGQMLV